MFSTHAPNTDLGESFNDFVPKFLQGTTGKKALGSSGLHQQLKFMAEQGADDSHHPTWNSG